MNKSPSKYGITLLTCLFLAVLCNSSVSAEVSIRPNGSCGPNCTLYAIAISGPVTLNTRAKFLSDINDPRIKATFRYTSSVVELNSPGGDVLQAIEIGRTTRKAGFMTFVGPNDECSSACVFILAAGVIRIADYGRVGIHRPHFDETYFGSLSLDDARAKYEQMSNSVRQYLSQMGMADALYLDMMKISSDDVTHLSAAQMTEYGLIGRDPAWSEYKRAQAIKKEGVEDYEVNTNWANTLVACYNKFGKSATCDRDALAEFHLRLESCTSESHDRVACSKAIAARMQQSYSTPRSQP